MYTISLTDIDECAMKTHNCNVDNATCIDTTGSFSCECKAGFTGNGIECQGTTNVLNNSANFFA